MKYYAYKKSYTSWGKTFYNCKCGYFKIFLSIVRQFFGYKKVELTILGSFDISNFLMDEKTGYLRIKILFKFDNHIKGN